MALKVMTLLGTRPEVIKLSRVISELERCTEHVLVHTGQNHDYELNEMFFQQLEIRNPDYFLGVAGDTTAKTIGNIIANSDEIMAKEQPDALLLLGDTNSCLAVISAKRRKIPVFHMEAGNRCFDERVPEEINRRLVDHLSDINLPYTEHARRYLLREGLRSETVIKTGSPMKEVLEYYQTKIQCSDVLTRLKLKPKEYFVVSSHREENIDSEANFTDFLNLLKEMTTKFNKRIIVSTHPRTRKKLEETGYSGLPSSVQFLKPMGFFDYVKLQTTAFCAVSDSGTITEESSILNFPAVMIRQAHERPEGMDEGTLIMCGLKPDRVLESIEIVSQQHDGNRRFKIVPDYDTDNVSQKVLRIIVSYTGYVNRTVWRR